MPLLRCGGRESKIKRGGGSEQAATGPPGQSQNWKQRPIAAASPDHHAAATGPDSGEAVLWAQGAVSRAVGREAELEAVWGNRENWPVWQACVKEVVLRRFGDFWILWGGPMGGGVATCPVPGSGWSPLSVLVQLDCQLGDCGGGGSCRPLRHPGQLGKIVAGGVVC